MVSGSRVAVLAVAALFAACSKGGESGMQSAKSLPPGSGLVANGPPLLGHCDSAGNCNLALTNNLDALALCEGNAPKLYWNQGREIGRASCRERV